MAIINAPSLEVGSGSKNAKTRAPPPIVIIKPPPAAPTHNSAECLSYPRGLKSLSSVSIINLSLFFIAFATACNDDLFLISIFFNWLPLEKVKKKGRKPKFYVRYRGTGIPLTRQ